MPWYCNPIQTIQTIFSSIIHSNGIYRKFAQLHFIIFPHTSGGNAQNGKQPVRQMTQVHTDRTASKKLWTFSRLVTVCNLSYEELIKFPNRYNTCRIWMEVFYGAKIFVCFSFLKTTARANIANIN